MRRLNCAGDSEKSKKEKKTEDMEIQHQRMEVMALGDSLKPAERQERGTVQVLLQRHMWCPDNRRDEMESSQGSRNALKAEAHH